MDGLSGCPVATDPEAHRRDLGDKSTTNARWVAGAQKNDSTWDLDP